MEEAKERTMQDVNVEYSKAMMRLGEIDFLIEKSLPYERDKLHDQAIKLQKEAERFQKNHEARVKKAQEEAETEKAKNAPTEDLKPNLEAPNA